MGNRECRARSRNRRFRARKGIQERDRDAGDRLFVVRADGRVLYQKVVWCMGCIFVDFNVNRIGNFLRVNRREHKSPRVSPVGGLVDPVC